MLWSQLSGAPKRCRQICSYLYDNKYSQPSLIDRSRSFGKQARLQWKQKPMMFSEPIPKPPMLKKTEGNNSGTRPCKGVPILLVIPLHPTAWKTGRDVHRREYEGTPTLWQGLFFIHPPNIHADANVYSEIYARVFRSTGRTTHAQCSRSPEMIIMLESIQEVLGRISWSYIPPVTYISPEDYWRSILS